MVTPTTSLSRKDVLSKNSTKDYPDNNSRNLLISKYYNNPINVVDFCAFHGISKSTFYKWRNIYDRAKSPKSNQSSFIKVTEDSKKELGYTNILSPCGKSIELKGILEVKDLLLMLNNFIKCL